MAVRLSVIMVHTPSPASPAAGAERMSEEVVGELIGLSGIDLTLVGPIAHLPEASTDRLTLGSLTGDVAVLDWQSPAKILDVLATIGFEGGRSPHAHDPSASTPATNLRRIYAFDLNEFSQSRDVIHALSELKSSRQVRTFTLDLSPRAAVGLELGSEVGSAAAPETPPSAKAAPVVVKKKSAAVPTAYPEAPLRSTHNHSKTTATPGESLNLDDLLDQLDQLDP